jgi:hypothetical protein
MMNKIDSKFITRRQLMQTAAAAALYLTLHNISGCSSAPQYKPLAAGEDMSAVYIDFENIHSH